MHGTERWGHALFRSDGLELDGGIIVGATARRTQSIHVRLDVVVAELPYLGEHVSQPWSCLAELTKAAHLVAAGAWPAVPVGWVELLDAEGAAGLLVMVDAVIL